MNLAWLLSAGVGGAVLLSTQDALWGILAGVATFFLVRWAQPRAPARPPRIDPPQPRPAERTTSTIVVCKTVTPARQEWVSLKTGRLYDVLSGNGLAGARPGDRGRVTLVGTTWRIDPLIPDDTNDQASCEEVDAP